MFPSNTFTRGPLGGHVESPEHQQSPHVFNIPCLQKSVTCGETARIFMLCYCNAIRGAASKNLGVVKEPAMNWVVFMALWIWPVQRKALTCWISDEWASSVTLVKRLCKSEGFRVNYQQSGWGIQSYQLCKTYGLGCKQPPLLEWCKIYARNV